MTPEQKRFEAVLKEHLAERARLLIRADQRATAAINDINSDLTNLYRCVKFHLAELVAQFRWMLVSRDEFDRFLKTPAEPERHAGRSGDLC